MGPGVSAAVARRFGSIGGALVAAQAVLPGMKTRGSGTLLFTGGGFAFEPTPALASLGVGKAGLRNLAFSFFAELKAAASTRPR